MKKPCLDVIFVTNKGDLCTQTYLDFVATCVQSGVSMAQLREKNLSPDALSNFALELQARLKDLGIPLVVNDDVDLCLQLNADGVHLGQGDGDVLEARKKLGNNKLIGLSVQTPAQVARANMLPIDYIGVGPVYPTNSKSDCEACCDLDGLAEIARLSKHPVVAIGGINADNITDVMRIGVSGVAAIEAFHHTSQGSGVVKLFRQKVILAKIRQQKPLVLNVTNAVTMDIIANSLLALGAAPLMTESRTELEELVKIASAVVLNIGTLNRNFMKRCLLAAKLAKRYQKPLILDPVGAGATASRTKAAMSLLPYATIVKGNASEILALAGQCQQTRGVESVHQTSDAKQAAFKLAKQYGCVVAVSGRINFITNGRQQTEVCGGSELMTMVTGMGCTLATVVAAFAAVSDDWLVAGDMAMHYFNQCGAKAASIANKPGSFRVAFLDCLYG